MTFVICDQAAFRDVVKSRSASIWTKKGKLSIQGFSEKKNKTWNSKIAGTIAVKTIVTEICAAVRGIFFLL